MSARNQIRISLSVTNTLSSNAGEASPFPFHALPCCWKNDRGRGRCGECTRRTCTCTYLCTYCHTDCRSLAGTMLHTQPDPTQIDHFGHRQSPICPIHASFERRQMRIGLNFSMSYTYTPLITASKMSSLHSWKDSYGVCFYMPQGRSEQASFTLVISVDSWS